MLKTNTLVNIDALILELKGYKKIPEFSNKSPKEARAILDKIRFRRGKPNANTKVVPIGVLNSDSGNHRNFLIAQNRAIPGPKNEKGMGSHIFYQSTGSNSGSENSGTYFPIKGVNQQSGWIEKYVKDPNGEYRALDDEKHRTFNAGVPPYEGSSQRKQRLVYPTYREISNRLEGINTSHIFRHLKNETPIRHSDPSIVSGVERMSLDKTSINKLLGDKNEVYRIKPISPEELKKL